MRSPSAKQRGFTLLEMMVVVAIFGILAALAVTQFLALKPQDQLRSAAKDLTVSLRQARTIAITGSSPISAFPWLVEEVDVTFDPVNDVYRMQLLTNDPAAMPNTLVYKVVRLADYRGAQLDLTLGFPGTVRFQRNGGTDVFADVTLTETQTGMNRQINVTRAGLARIAN